MCMFHTYQHVCNMCYGTFRLQVYELTFMSGGVCDGDGNGDGTTARETTVVRETTIQDNV